MGYGWRVPNPPRRERPIQADAETGVTWLKEAEPKHSFTFASGLELWTIEERAYIDFGEPVDGEDEPYSRDPRRMPGWFDEVVRLAADRDDARQEAILYLACAPRRFFEDGDGNVTGDVGVMARKLRRKVRDIARARKDKDAPVDEGADLDDAIDIHDLRAADAARGTSTSATLAHALLDRLNDVQRRRVWLHLAEGWTLEKIARAEGVTKQSVSESVRRAVEMLR